MKFIKKDEGTRQPSTEVYSSDEVEIWWDTKIKTLTKLEHDRPDIVLWKRKESKCYIMDVCVCLDVNIDKNIKHKLDSYLPLAAELKRLYKEHDFDQGVQHLSRVQFTDFTDNLLTNQGQIY